MKNLFLKIPQNLQENTCAKVSFSIKLQAEACNFIKKETSTQVISCNFHKIFNNTIFNKKLFSKHFRWLLLLSIRKSNIVKASKTA